MSIDNSNQMDIPRVIAKIRTDSKTFTSEILQAGKDAHEEINARIGTINKEIQDLQKEVDLQKADKKYISWGKIQKELQIKSKNDRIKNLTKEIKSLNEMDKEIALLQGKLQSANSEDILKINKYSKNLLGKLQNYSRSKIYSQSESLKTRITALNKNIEGIENRLTIAHLDLLERKRKLFESQQNKINRIATWSFSTNRLKTYVKVDAHIRSMEQVKSIIDKPQEAYDAALSSLEKTDKIKREKLPQICAQRFKKDIAKQAAVIDEFEEKYGGSTSGGPGLAAKGTAISIKDATLFRDAVGALDKLTQEAEVIKGEFQPAQDILIKAREMYQKNPQMLEKISKFTAALNKAKTEAEFKKIHQEIREAFKDLIATFNTTRPEQELHAEYMEVDGKPDVFIQSYQNDQGMTALDHIKFARSEPHKAYMEAENLGKSLEPKINQLPAECKANCLARKRKIDQEMDGFLRSLGVKKAGLKLMNSIKSEEAERFHQSINAPLIYLNDDVDTIILIYNNSNSILDGAESECRDPKKLEEIQAFREELEKAGTIDELQIINKRIREAFDKE